jgi:hypothetical protein
VDLTVEGGATLKAAVIPIVLHYASGDPLSYASAGSVVVSGEIAVLLRGAARDHRRGWEPKSHPGARNGPKDPLDGQLEARPSEHGYLFLPWPPPLPLLPPFPLPLPLAFEPPPRPFELFPPERPLPPLRPGALSLFPGLPLPQLFAP